MQGILTVVPFNALMELDTVTSMPKQAVKRKRKISVNNVKVSSH